MHFWQRAATHSRPRKFQASGCKWPPQNIPSEWLQVVAWDECRGVPPRQRTSHIGIPQMSSGGNASSQCVVRGNVVSWHCIISQCVVTMRRQGVMCRQWTMRRQAMCRHNASSGGPGVIVNLLSQCVVSVSAETHTQAAGALYIYIYYIFVSVYTFIYTYVRSLYQSVGVVLKNKALPGYYNGQAKMDGFTTVFAAASWMIITKISEYHDHLLTHLQRLEQKRLEIQ